MPSASRVRRPSLSPSRSCADVQAPALEPVELLVGIDLVIGQLDPAVDERPELVGVQVLGRRQEHVFVAVIDITTLLGHARRPNWWAASMPRSPLATDFAVPAMVLDQPAGLHELLGHPLRPTAQPGQRRRRRPGAADVPAPCRLPVPHRARRSRPPAGPRAWSARRSAGSWPPPTTPTGPRRRDRSNASPDDLDRIRDPSTTQPTHGV